MSTSARSRRCRFWRCPQAPSKTTWRAWSGRAGSAMPRRCSPRCAACARRPLDRAPPIRTSCPTSSALRRPTPRSARCVASCAACSASTANRWGSDIVYLNALEFLEEEREAWRPYEALADLSDEQLDVAIDAAHDWSGRDLVGHIVAWQSNALDVAKELAVGETSATKERSDREWDERGDDINAEIQAEWRGP